MAPSAVSPAPFAAAEVTAPAAWIARRARTLPERSICAAAIHVDCVAVRYDHPTSYAVPFHATVAAFGNQFDSTSVVRTVSDISASTMTARTSESVAWDS